MVELEKAVVHEWYSLGQSNEDQARGEAQVASLKARVSVLQGRLADHKARKLVGDWMRSFEPDPTEADDQPRPSRLELADRRQDLADSANRRFGLLLAGQV
jgi:hypothetical protein